MSGVWIGDQLAGELEGCGACLQLFIELGDADCIEYLSDLGSGFEAISEEVIAIDEVWGIKLCGGDVGKVVPGEIGVDG